MSRPELHAALRRELEWAVQTLVSQGSPSGEQMERIRAAIHAKSPMLWRRFGLFFDNCLPMDLASEDRNRIGALMLALEANAKGEPWRLYQPDEWAPDGRSTKGAVIQIRCEESWKARLQAYCQRSGHDASWIIRRAVDAYLEDNPLWRGLTDHAGAADDE